MNRFKRNYVAGIALALCFSLAGSVSLASAAESSVSVSIDSQDESSEAKTYVFSLEFEIRRMLMDDGAMVVTSAGSSKERFSISGGTYVSGDGRLTVKTELSDIATGKVIWAQSYNRDIGPEVDDIASDVVKNVVPRMKAATG